jgi:MFS transporter, SP family, sugar:H+ symporter
MISRSGGFPGGLTQMTSFLEAFFPDILEKMSNAQQDEYCIFDSQVLTTFVSSLYLAGMFACLVAGHVTRKVGRRTSMLIGASFFFVGAVLNCAAVNIYMLVIGRILLGFAVGFTNQVRCCRGICIMYSIGQCNQLHINRTALRGVMS